MRGRRRPAGSKLAKPGRLTVAPGASARTMTDKDGKQFVCYLPPPGGQGEADGDGDDGNDLAAALATAVRRQGPAALHSRRR